MAETKKHTTNYINTFIEVSSDTRAEVGTTPISKKDIPTIAEMQYKLISSNPYRYTSDDVIFQVHAQRSDLSKSEMDAAKEDFFSKGRACLRTSPLSKNYGFGIHHDKDGKVALYGRETEAYQRFLSDESVKKVKAMRSKK